MSNPFVPNETFTNVTPSGAQDVVHTVMGVVHDVFVTKFTSRRGDEITEYNLVLDQTLDYDAVNPSLICFVIPEKLALRYQMKRMIGINLGLWFRLKSFSYVAKGTGEEKYVLKPTIFQLEDLHGQLFTVDSTNVQRHMPQKIESDHFAEHSPLFTHQEIKQKGSEFLTMLNNCDTSTLPSDLEKLYNQIRIRIEEIYEDDLPF